MLSIESLTVGYGSQPVLKEISLTVQPGEIIALIGPNGAGKTTLFRAVSGVLHPSSGHVYAFSQEISQLPTDRRARLLAVVPQARRLPAGYTVRRQC
jgi:ABC-type cobalamin/Fe3+-siderophores transport system ATPase subunit